MEYERFVRLRRGSISYFFHRCNPDKTSFTDYVILAGDLGGGGGGARVVLPRDEHDNTQ
jgi:hypothetical protein